MTNDTFLYPDYKRSYGAIIFIILSVITMLISCPGNLLTVIVIIRTERLRKEATYLLICSMCVADIFVSTLAQPLLITTMVIGTRASCSVDNVFFITSWAMAMSSALAIITITLDRFLYISYPLRYKLYMTKRKAKFMITLVWITSSLFGSLPMFWYNGLILHTACLLVLISISAALVYTYSKISRKVHSVNVKTDRGKGRSRSQRQATKTVLTIVLTFFICWCPWVIVSFVVALHNDVASLQKYKRDSFMITLYWLFLVFGHSNSAFNIFIYSQKDKILCSTIKSYLGFNNKTNLRGELSVLRPAVPIKMQSDEKSDEIL